MTLKTHGAGGRLGHLPRVWGRQVESWVREAGASSLFSLQVFISTVSHPSPWGPATSGCSQQGVSLEAGAGVTALPCTASCMPLNHHGLEINQDE